MRNLKSIIRSFRRKPTTSIINLLGLSISLALVIILSAYCYSELTIDKYKKNKDNAFIVSYRYDGENFSNMPGVLKTVVDERMPDVPNAVRICDTWNPPVFEVENNRFESDLIFADKGFFELFTYEPIEGDLSTALNEPMSIVLTEELANKLFGNNSPIGKTVNIDSQYDFTVKAVIRSPENKTFLRFSSLASMESRKTVMPSEGVFTSWEQESFKLFIKTADKTGKSEVAEKLILCYPEDAQESYKEANAQFELTELDKIYFSDIDVSFAPYIRKGNVKTPMLLLLVSALTLIIALFNFINISTFHWHDKLKQTGTLKVFGASHNTIIFNMLLEALLMFIVAFILSLLFIRIILPVIQNSTGLDFNRNNILSLRFIALAFLSNILICLIISIIPIIKVAGSKTINNLKNTVSAKGNRNSTRGILVGIQFVISIVLVAFTLLIQKQIKFGNSNLGFSSEMNVVILLNNQMWNKDNVIRDFLDGKATVKQYSFTSFYPGKELNSWSTIADINGEKKQMPFDIFSGDDAFVEIMGLNIKSGENFKKNDKTNANKVLVNETFVKEYKIDNPIGFVIPNYNLEIIGIVNDFHSKSVNEKITPLVICNKGWNATCIVNFSTNNFNAVHSTIEEIEKFTRTISGIPVGIKFLDQAVADMYKSEVQFRRTFMLFALAAIVICMLGVFAMTLFACQKRIKEIGIRKVNGAKISEILTMLNKDFVKWVVIAFVVATPIAYYAMNKWLENFAYKTALNWWIFALAGTLALGIALLTVSWQSWRAATRNPVEALRYE